MFTMQRFELLSAEMEKQAVASELDIGAPIASTVVDAASVCGLDAVLHCQRKTPATKMQPAELSKPNYHAYWTMLSGWNGPNNISNSIDSVHWNLLVLGLLAHTALSFLYSLHRQEQLCLWCAKYLGGQAPRLCLLLPCLLSFFKFFFPAFTPYISIERNRLQNVGSQSLTTWDIL